MNSYILLAGLLGGTLVVADSVTTTTRPSSPPSTRTVSRPAAPVLIAQFTGVRAEFTVDSSKLGHIDTELVMANTHGTKTLRLKDVVVLGRNGLHTTLSIYKGLNGGFIPPLGQVVLPINGSIGVKAGSATVRSPQDVASVIVIWDGPLDALNLTAVIKQRRQSATYAFLATSVSEGYKVKFN